MVAVIACETSFDNGWSWWPR